MEEKESLFSKLLKSFSKQEGLEELLQMCEHWNGYKRENAVRRLGMLGNPLAIPKLIARANDWVPQVRSAATDAINKLATPKNAEAFVYSLPKLYHLKDCGRDNHDKLITSIEKFLLSNEISNHVLEGLHNESPLVARACVSLIIENGLMDQAELVEISLSHPDVIVRVKVSHLLRGLKGDDQALALRVAIKDQFMPIRREAFQILIKTGISDALTEKFLFDRHSAIREIAIKSLENKGSNVRMIYQKNLSSKSPFTISCALWGLGELNCTDDVSDIQSFLSSFYPGIRKQALNTLTRLVGADATDAIVNSLSDKSPAVCKEAARLANRQRIAFTAINLLEIISNTVYIHTLTSCLGISKRLNKWERLIFLISLFDENYLNKVIEKEQITLAIKQWDLDFNRSASQPTKAQLDVLGKKIKEFDEMLGSYEYRSVVFTLQSYGVEF